MAKQEAQYTKKEADIVTPRHQMEEVFQCCIRMMGFVFKMMGFVFKMMNFAFKMMNFEAQAAGLARVSH